VGRTDASDAGVSYERGTPVLLRGACPVRPRQEHSTRSGDKPHVGVQGYLAHKKQPPPRTLQ